HGSLVHRTLAWLVTGACRTPDGGGYWLAASDGHVSAFGDAGAFGSHRAKHSAQAIVGIAPATEGAGYWLAASDGHVSAFGAAAAYGSPIASGPTWPARSWPSPPRRPVRATGWPGPMAGSSPTVMPRRTASRPGSGCTGRSCR